MLAPVSGRLRLTRRRAPQRLLPERARRRPGRPRAACHENLLTGRVSSFAPLAPLSKISEFLHRNHGSYCYPYTDSSGASMATRDAQTPAAPTSWATIRLISSRRIEDKNQAAALIRTEVRAGRRV